MVRYVLRRLGHHAGTLAIVLVLFTALTVWAMLVLAPLLLASRMRRVPSGEAAVSDHMPTP